RQRRAAQGQLRTAADVRRARPDEPTRAGGALAGIRATTTRGTAGRAHYPTTYAGTGSGFGDGARDGGAAGQAKAHAQEGNGGGGRSGHRGYARGGQHAGG